jgi:hypothetical protein
MRSWWDWVTERHVSQPWLLIGKGPTFADVRRRDCGRILTFGLNHVVREMPLAAAHAIDLEVVENIPAETLLRNAGVLVMPWHPHRQFRAAAETLEDCLRNIPVLAEFERRDRLVYYHLSTGSRFGDSGGRPVVPVRYFSAEAAVFLLAAAGVRTIRAAGIDGGTAYAAPFGDLQPLTNGRGDFDDQTAEIERTVTMFGIDFRRFKIDD